MSVITDAGEITAELIAASQPSGETLNEVWLWWAGILVLLMHLGFAFLEAGSVQKKNALNVMYKNIMTITLGGIAYYFLGYALFSAGEIGSTFAGGDNWLLVNEDNIVDATTAAIPYSGSQYFFQFAFAATAATIVSGAVAGRITLPAYAVAVVFITGFQYPVVAHWVWATTGWLTAFYTSSCGDPAPADCPNLPIVEGSAGLMDFAGSGVVHMSGGFAALGAIMVLGPRDDAEGPDGKIVPPPPASETLMAIGVFVLWIGWYGFNCGSTLTIYGYAGGMGHAAICTTLAPSAAIVTAMIVGKLTKGYYDLASMLNSCLAGLVSITASANVMNFGWSIFIGCVGCLVYIASAKLLIWLKLDDPVGAIAVHGFCGIWGVLAVPLATGVSNPSEQFAQQLLGVTVILLWNMSLTYVLFLAMAMGGFRKSDKEKKEKFLRATAKMQEDGLDMSEHSGEIYASF